jgi:RNA polymerase sigma factor (sigma-70 family)
MLSPAYNLSDDGDYIVIKLNVMKFPQWGYGTKGSGNHTNADTFGAEELTREYFKVFVAYLISRGYSRQDAEAIVSTILVKIWTNKRTFPNLEEGWKYLYVSVRHAMNDGHTKTYQPLSANTPIGTVPSPEEAKIAMDTYLEIWEVVSMEPTKRARIVTMQLDGYTTDEIAAELNISPQTVRNAGNKGIRNIQERLVARGIVPPKRLADARKKKKKST